MSTFITGSGASSGASIQPMGDYTTVGTNDYKSGNPNYTDASAGGSTPKVPNADPHMMQKKGGKNYAKNKKKQEFLMMFGIIEQKQWQPGDPEIMYVESSTPKQCGTCEFYDGCNQEYGKCNVPPNGLAIPVHPINGCCNKWSQGSDDAMEAFEEALEEAKSMQLQSFVFDKGSFDNDSAKAWLQKYKKSSDLDTGGPSIRARQKDPASFDQKSFRTITIKKGIKAVVGKAKEMEAAKRFCKGCSNAWGEKDITCSKCGSMEYTTGMPMTSFTINSP